MVLLLHNRPQRQHTLATQQRPHTMVLHWLHITMTTGILLLSQAGQVCPQQEQSETNTGSADARADNGGLSSYLIAIIVAACIGLFIAVVLGVFCYFHYKRSRLGEMSLEKDALPHHYKSTDSGVKVTSMEMTEDANSGKSTPRHIINDTDSRPSPAIVLNKWKDFKTLLEELRPQAETILVMLNDVRKRLREAKHGNPRIDGYKAVIRDLSRVLFLLNKKEDKIKMPPDGVELLTWGQQIVNKYTDCQKIKAEREANKSYDTPPEMSAVLWIQSKDDSAFDDEHHEESHVI